MKIAHLSDLHLGFRAFPGIDRGWNLRERDVSSAFQRAIQETARLRPDLVLLTGDLFDRPDPPSTAFLSLSRGVRTLQALLPGVPVLAIAGERDTPDAPADPGPVAVLDALPGVEAAAGAPRAVRLTELGVHALLIPHRAIRTPPLPELRPDPEARWNVLLLRADPRGRAGQAIGIEVDPGEWDYIAVGGAHGARRHFGHAHTAGSLERIGWNPWSEATEEKGFVFFDTERGEGEFHPVSTRALVDLAPVRTTPEAPAEGTRRLRHLIEGIPGGVEGKLVRIRLEGDLITPEEGVDPALLAGIRQRAAHLEVRVEGGGGRGERDEPSTTGVGLDLLLAPTRALLDRTVARLMASGTVTTVQGGPAGDRERVLRFGGDPAQILECARSLLAPPTSAVGSEGDPAPASSRKPLDRLEAELRIARGDAIEAEGEVEARTLEWARDRQEAETRLLGYRDRARELRERLRALEAEDASCPTCGSVLADAGERLRTTLKEEWEMVVQDGRWWKRRREQLDGKPDDLVELEGEALRLRAAMERLSEELERRRVASTGPAPDVVVAGGGRGEGFDAPASPEARRALRRLLRRASGHLRIWSEGELSGVALDPQGRVMVVEGGSGRTPSPEEGMAVSLVLHMALLAEAASSGVGFPERVLLRGLDHRGVDPLLEPLLRIVPRRINGSPTVLIAHPPSAPRPGIPGLGGLLAPAAGRPLEEARRVPLGPVRVGWVGGARGSRSDLADGAE